MVQTGIKYNKSTRYLLPLLKFSTEFYNLLRRNGFVNLYLEDKEYTKPTSNCIFLLMKPNYLNKEFNIIDEKLKSNKLFYDYYEIDSDTFMYVFKLIIDSEIYALENFWLSKFSKMVILLKYIEPTINGQINEVYHSIKKTNEYRKILEDKLDVKIDESWELGDILDFNEEIYRYNE